ncbi:Taurine dioxygenase, alpha-ketoglutarate-dependent [Asanoa hainanensis]|uniref:Taurine dioxygenase, alpha-ketoglutarate-dependent n=1 Tax=Asanoa hainanensis TaxID=560556 RepID=A0A239PFV0_9ACTN|nr:TauD/TfdA family dioxygenase [Asanoa hainanensis]SNT65893.1 Taurine dioxygenase, alpha-ketoglutarate-dependent [Asanoa hainanensis]
MNFPHLVNAPHRGTDLRTWLEGHAGHVDEALAGAGAILLRGFDVTSAEQFHDLATVPLGPLMQYVEGASPRAARGEGVYTSTEYAADLTVSMHNELSYSHRWPARVAFFCRVPAADGGHTPIADSRRLYQRLAARGLLPDTVQYRRRMPPDKGFGLSWPTVFGTTNQQAVNEYCRDAEIDATWLPDGTLITRQVRPTAVVHPVTGDKVWFNQAHQWHPSNSGPESEAALRELFGDELPMDARAGDGTPLAPAALDAIREAYEQETTSFAWKAGDVMIIDNMLSAHGRTPFTGDREVLVAMGTPVSLADVKQVAA